MCVQWFEIPIYISSEVLKSGSKSNFIDWLICFHGFRFNRLMSHYLLLLLRLLNCCCLTLLFNVESICKQTFNLWHRLLRFACITITLTWWNAHIVYYSDFGMLAYAETLTQKCEQRHDINTLTPTHNHTYRQVDGFISRTV